MLPPPLSVQTALAHAGLSLAGSPYVDRDQLLSLLASQWGVQPWLDCTGSKELAFVSTCLDPSNLNPVGEPLVKQFGAAPPQHPTLRGSRVAQ